MAGIDWSQYTPLQTPRGRGLAGPSSSGPSRAATAEVDWSQFTPLEDAAEPQTAAAPEGEAEGRHRWRLPEGSLERLDAGETVTVTEGPRAGFGLERGDDGAVRLVTPNRMPAVDWSQFTPLDDEPAAPTRPTPQPARGAGADEQGRLSSALATTTQRAVGVGTSALKYPAIEAQQNLFELTEKLDRIDAGRTVPDYTPIAAGPIGAFGAGQAPDWRNDLLNDYRRAGPDARRRMRQDLIAAGFEADPRESGLYRLGARIDRWVADNVPANPRYREEFWASQIPGAVGDMIGFMATAAATRGAGVRSKMGQLLSVASTGAALNSVGEFEQALDQDATLEQAFEAADWAAVTGTSEAVPIVDLLNRLDKGSGGAIKRALKNALKSGFEEGGQELFQTIVSNAVAQKIYDPERGLWQGAGQAGAVGTTTGGLLAFIGTLATSALGRRRGHAVEPASEPAGDALAAEDTGLVEPEPEADEPPAGDPDDGVTPQDLSALAAQAEPAAPQAAEPASRPPRESEPPAAEEPTTAPAPGTRAGRAELLAALRYKREHGLAMRDSERAMLAELEGGVPQGQVSVGVPEIVEPPTREPEPAPSAASTTADRVLAPETPQYADPRLKRAPYRRALKQAAQELTRGARKRTGDIDPARDDLLSAIAKAGGIERAEAEAQGVDPEHFKDAQRVFAKPLFPKQGGKSVDAMAETLSQDGYLSVAEVGNFTANELVDKLSTALGGQPVYSAYYESDPQADALVELTEGLKPTQVRVAVDKALAGKALGVRQARIVAALLDRTAGERAREAEPVRAELQRARELRRIARINPDAAADVPIEAFDDAEAERAGERLAEAEYEPDWDGEQRALFELVSEANEADGAATERVLVAAERGGWREAQIAARLGSIIVEGRRRGRAQAAQPEPAAPEPADTRGDRARPAQPSRGPPAQAPPAGGSELELAPTPAPAGVSASPAPAAPEQDLLGEVPEREQRLADARREVDERLAPSAEAPPVEADEGLFGGGERQRDIEDVPTEQAPPAAERIGEASSEVDTAPSEAQKKAGNYQKGHVRLHGLDISIENPAGSTRSGTDPATGKRWQSTLNHPYGYIRRSEGADGDQVDVFVGPDVETPEGSAFVVDQIDPQTGAFDEHKVMLGFRSATAARAAYLANYAKDWQGLGALSSYSINGLKEWLQTGKLSEPVKYRPTRRADETASARPSREEIEAFIEQAARAPQPSGEIVLEPAGAREIADIKAQGGPDVSGMNHVLSAQALKHALRAHGRAEVEEARGQRELTVDDLKAIPDVLSDYDALEVQPRTGNRTSVVYRKRLANGRLAYVERVIETSRRKKPRLITRTAWVSSSTGAEASPLPVSTPGRIDRVPPSKAALNIADFTNKQGQVKSIVVTGDTKVHKDRITGAVGAAPLWNRKAQGWIFPKKREPQVRAALADLLGEGEAASASTGTPGAPAAQPAEQARDEGLQQQPQAAPAGAPQEPGKRPADYGAANKVFTSAAAEAARETLRKKLGQVSSGIDPELMQAGITLAGYHIESGARSFADYSKAMIADLGEAVHPYLKSFYEAVRAWPGFDTTAMTPAEQIPAAPETATLDQTATTPKRDTASDEREEGGSEAALGGAPPEALPRAQGERGTGGRPRSGGGQDAGRHAGDGGRRDGPARGVRDRESAVSVPARGAAERDRLAGDYVLTDADRLGEGGPKAKFQANLDAIGVLKTLQREGRGATAHEQAVLARYVGWGGLAQAFDPDNTKWANEYAALKQALSEAEYAAARRSTQDAHYTSATAVNAMWAALQRLGFTGGRVLEPSMGVGNFLGLMPSQLRGRSALTGVELDPLTGAIAEHLYPRSTVHAGTGFHQTRLATGTFDVAIGNPPFGSQQVFDPEHKDISKFSIHNYFFAKSLDKLREGGVLAMVVSHSLMDKAGATQRQYLSARARLLGAIRLPNTAFKANAGTEVTTDIVFLQKRGEGDTDAGEAWTQIASTPDPTSGEPIPINEYFARHPEQMLGQMSLAGSMYRAGTPTLEPDAEVDLDAALAQAIERLPRDAMTTPARAAAELSDSETLVGAPDEIKIYGHYRTDDGRIAQRVPSLAGARGEVQSLSASAHARASALIELRDSVRALLARELDPASSETQLRLAREKLNATYERLTQRFGAVHARANRQVFNEDPDYALLLSLERDYDAGIGATVAKREGVAARKPTWSKADIFTRRVLMPYRRVEHAESAADALSVALSETGRVDLERMSELTGSDRDTLLGELKGQVYLDPEAGAVTREAYLSGNVKHKLAVAQAAARENPAMADNVAALEAVQPADIEAVDIDVRLGSPWVPGADVQDFIRELIGASSTVSFQRALGKWVVDVPVMRSTAATATWGTERMDAGTLIDKLLSNSDIVVRDKVSDGEGGETSVVNQAETLAARAKAQALGDEFKDWIWRDDARRRRLARVYNDTFNTERTRAFDGAHLALPGINPNIALRAHQKDFVWRVVQEGGGLADHSVGAGKTFALIAAAMEQRRMGLARKPMFVVPNHLVGQWAAAFTTLYPGARVLAASKKDFERANRQRFFAKVTTGDWDAVIVAHSSFERIPMPSAARDEILNEQIDDIEAALEEMRGDGDRMTIKELEKQRDRLQAKIERAAEGKEKDTGVDFAELGVDQLYVDECLPYETPILTDRGLLPIGEIVEQRLPVRVLSYNSYTNALQWKPVVQWFTKGLSGPLVRVHHSHGAFDCTPTHKVWTLEHGYVRAGELTENHHLRVVPQALSHPEGPCWQSPTSLLAQMRRREHTRAHAGDQALSMVRAQLYVSLIRGAQQRQALVVLQLVCGFMAQSSSRTRRGVQCLDRRGAQAPAWAESADIGAHEAQQPHAQFAHARENAPQQTRSNLSLQGRQPEDYPATTPAWRTPRLGTGVCHQNGICQGALSEPAQLLPRGPSSASTPPSDRGRWANASASQVETYRSAQDARAGVSRMVRVEVLERGDRHGLGDGGDDSGVVYDIEVADNHNYFARGALVSNSHEFKNLFFHTSMNRIAGLGNTGSQKAFDLFVKTRYLQGLNGGRGLVFATGTPVSNTMAELYTLQRYHQYDDLKARGLAHFDAWAATFGEVVAGFELDATGVNYKLNRRFAKFVNMPELMAMYRSFSDVITTADLQRQAAAAGARWPVPKVAGGAPGSVVVERSAEQADYMESIVSRAQNLPKDPAEDNMLAITGDARKMALDMRLIDPAASDDAGSKVNAAAERIAELHRQWQSDKAAQLVFIDLSTPKTGKAKAPAPSAGEAEAGVSMDELLAGRSRFDVYNDLKTKLIERGIPAREIAFIHEANTELQKEALFDRVRRGEVRVLFGSTAKMGAGMNVQERLVALHHLDAPWRPSDIEQREGRIIRQGNALYERDPEGFEVEVNRYATKQTYDARMWQTLEVKARFIEQLRAGDTTLRTIEDIGGEAANFADLKAAATGNPLILEQVRLAARVRELDALATAHKRTQMRLADRVQYLAQAPARAQAQTERLQSDIATRDANTPSEGVNVTVAGTRYTDKKAATEALGKGFVAFAKGAAADTELGAYRGFALSAHKRGLQVVVALEGAGSYDTVYERADKFSAGGLMTRLDNALKGLEGQIDETHARAKHAAREHAGAAGELGKPFEQAEAYDAAKAQLNAVMDELERMKEPDYQARALDEVLRRGGEANTSAASADEQASYARGTGRSRASAERVRAWLAEPIERLNVPVEIVATVAELGERAGLVEPAPADAQGVTYQARVYLVAENLASRAQARRILTHEAAGHLGLEGMLGPQGFNELVRRVQGEKRLGNRTIAAAAQRVAETHGALDADTEAREILAHLAERGIQHSLLRRVVAGVRAWLARMGLGNLATAEIERLIARAARHVERRPRRAQARDARGRFTSELAAYARELDTTPEQLARELDAVVEVRDEQGRLLAPNGEVSNLNERQWKLVRTPRFKAWFGDFEAPGNVEAVKQALQKIVDGAAEATAKGLRHDLKAYGGDADVHFAWGNDTMGLAHIAGRRGADTALRVARATALGSIAKYVEGKKTVHIAHEGVTAILSLHERGHRKTWLLAGWQEGKPDARSEVGARSAATQSASTFSRDELGAGLESILTPPTGVSKVVDERGEPRVVYHGTNADVSAFALENSLEDVPAIYATSDPTNASAFAAYRRTWTGANVMSIFVRLTNPLTIEGDRKPIREVEERFIDERRRVATDETVEALAQRQGHDGIVYRNVVDEPESPRIAQPTTVYAAFAPTQIKSATANRGSFDANDPRIDHARAAPTFYSQMQRVLADKLPGRATPGELKRAIEAFVKKGQIKAEEVEWSGINEWLAAQTSKLTRERVLEFVRANEMRVEEVQKGAGAKYADYTLPGGKNYRELLLTLPRASEYGEATVEDYGGAWTVIGPDGRHVGQYDKTDPRAREKAERHAAQISGVPLGTKAQSYQSSHYREPNIVAHVRFNERTDSEGKRVLFVEEVQSDWHQSGRKKGYRGEREITHYSLQNPDTGGYVGSFDSEAQAREYRQSGARSDVREFDIVARAREGVVAQAPFKTTWPMLAMKRMIRYAADNGFEAIAWTTGAQQAGRYQLSQQVKTVQWSPSQDGKAVSIVPVSGNDIEFVVDADARVTGGGLSGTQFDGHPISEVVGKELGERIVGERAGEAAGDGLKVGGEGMKAFYDRLLPNEVNKYVKKWGAKVGKAGIDTVSKDDKPNLTEAEQAELAGVDEALDELGGADTDAARQRRKRLRDERGAIVKRARARGEPVHALDVTDKMREAALEGQALFARAATTETARRLAAMDPVTIDAQAFGSTDNPNELRQRASDFYMDTLRSQRPRPVNRYDGRVFKFSRAGIGKLKSHSADTRGLKMVAKLPQILEAAVPLGSKAATGDEQNIRAYHHYAVSVTLGGQPLWIRVLAREDDKGEFFYDIPELRKRDVAPKQGDLAAAASDPARHPAIAKIADWIEKFQGEPPRYARAGTAAAEEVDAGTAAGQTAQSFLARGQPVERVVRAPLAMLGLLDAQGEMKLTKAVHDKAKRFVTEYTFDDNSRFMGWANPLLHKVRAGLIDRYGLSEEFVQREAEMASEQRRRESQAVDFLQALSEGGVQTPAEWATVKAMLEGEAIEREDWQRLGEPIRRAIDDMGQEAVELGLISPESYQRNRGSYLHRVYAKHEASTTAAGRLASQFTSRYRRRITGNTLKGRGMDMKVSQARLLRDAPAEWWGRKRQAGAADTALAGERFVVLDKLREPGAGVEAIEGLEAGGTPAKLERRVYWPADKAIPARLGDYANKGTWEVRAVSGDKLTLWRDFTKQERTRMGEILDARYVVAKTFHSLAHDIATAKFFRDIAAHKEWTFQGEGEPPGEVMEPGRFYDTYTAGEWVRVPETPIAGTGGKKRWGALAGRYVRAEIWRDLNEMDRMNQSGWWNELLRFWKLNKTSRNPVVHMNNVMSNVMLMDLMDVRAQDLVRGIYHYARATEEYREAEQHGAFGNTFISSEIRDSVMNPALAEVLKTLEGQSHQGIDGSVRVWSSLLYALHKAGKGIKAADGAMQGLYQAEDQVFRMAAYLAGRAKGQTQQAAATAARTQFIDYDIRAPWVNALRRSVLPFLSYTYRAAPLVAESIAARPWKFAKYAVVAHMVNALGYALAPGDEDEERAALREAEQGRTWLATPRMIRMPWRDGFDHPLFLDTRRWIPAGDVFDMNQGAIPLLPAWLQFGGPLMLGAEIALNRVAFTGEPIYNDLTDSNAEIAKAFAGHLWRSGGPSAPWVPGSWYWDKIGRARHGALDPLGRRYSVPLAVSSSFGVKLKPLDTELQYRYKGWDFQARERALRYELRQLSRDRARRLIDDDAYREGSARVERKLRHLQQNARETFRYAQ